MKQNKLLIGFLLGLAVLIGIAAVPVANLILTTDMNGGGHSITNVVSVLGINGLPITGGGGGTGISTNGGTGVNNTLTNVTAVGFLSSGPTTNTGPMIVNNGTSSGAPTLIGSFLQFVDTIDFARTSIGGSGGGGFIITNGTLGTIFRVSGSTGTPYFYTPDANFDGRDVIPVSTIDTLGQTNSGPVSLTNSANQIAGVDAGFLNTNNQTIDQRAAAQAQAALATGTAFAAVTATNGPSGSGLATTDFVNQVVAQQPVITASSNAFGTVLNMTNPLVIPQSVIVTDTNGNYHTSGSTFVSFDGQTVYMIDTNTIYTLSHTGQKVVGGGGWSGQIYTNNLQSGAANAYVSESFNANAISNITGIIWTTVSSGSSGAWQTNISGPSALFGTYTNSVNPSAITNYTIVVPRLIPINLSVGQLQVTNFVSGQIYTNGTIYQMAITAPESLTLAGVSGICQVNFQAGPNTASLFTLSSVGQSTTTLSIGETNYMTLMGRVPSGWVFVITNNVSGSGNSAANNPSATNSVLFQ